MDDPYQYETAPQEWLDNYIEALEIKRRWGTITAEDMRHLQLLLAEQRRRDFVIEFYAPRDAAE